MCVCKMHVTHFCAIPLNTAVALTGALRGTCLLMLGGLWTWEINPISHTIQYNLWCWVTEQSSISAGINEVFVILQDMHIKTDLKRWSTSTLWTSYSHFLYKFLVYNLPVCFSFYSHGLHVHTLHQSFIKCCAWNLPFTNNTSKRQKGGSRQQYLRNSLVISGD